MLIFNLLHSYTKKEGCPILFIDWTCKKDNRVIGGVRERKREGDAPGFVLSTPGKEIPASGNSTEVKTVTIRIRTHLSLLQ